MSVYVTKLVEEIKLLKGSRAREETVRAKATCVGGARKKLARAKIKSLPERIKYQGENVAERQDALETPMERPLQRQSQSGGLYEDAKRFMAGAFDFMGLGHGTCDEHPRESGRFGKIPVKERRCGVAEYQTERTKQKAELWNWI